MKKKLLLLTLAASAVVAFAAKDPVLMTINGKDVKLSEFEYLYHKNNAQQLEKETLDEYIDRFVVYKLKVADAEAAGLDTLESFKKELDGYRRDVVAPFLRDTTVIDSMEKEAYANTLHTVEVSHIMRPLGNGIFDGIREQMFMDSLYTALKNGADFEEAALKYSVDRSVQRNKGKQGYVLPGRFPITFEEASFKTPVGEISKPFATPYGYHIVKTLSDKETKGTVLVEHILRLFKDKSDSAKLVAKKEIDDIYTRLKNGEDFETIAKAESQDPGSAKDGGKLPWFGFGRMVKSFEDVSFGLQNGEISEPFETPYGYHIVKKLDSKPNPTFDEIKEGIHQRIMMDERSERPRLAKMEQLKKELNYKIDPGFEKYINETLKAYGSYDSTYVVDVLGKSTATYCTFDNVKVPISRFATRLTTREKSDTVLAKYYIMKQAEAFGGEEMMRYYQNSLISKNPDYMNLLNEYHDGMLLFDISNKKVWEGASKDTEGLAKYFEQHRADFKWDAPHFKGIILKAKNDRVMNLVKFDIVAWNDVDSLTTKLFNKYRSNIKMERMLVSKGENALVDYLLFGGAKPAEVDKKYSTAMVLEGGLQEQPEVVGDVLGQVTSAYQDELEKKWVDELKTKYPVVIDKKVRKKIK